MKNSFRLIVALLISCWCLPLAANPTAQPAPIIRYDSIHHPLVSREGMVVSQHQLASDVGARILAQGGNAVDASVAVGFALAVVLPRAGNLGGGGFMMLHLAQENKTLAIDYREMAPAKAHRDLFLDPEGAVDKQKARFSHAAAGVPGTVAGLVHAQEKYGSLSLKQVIKPAIELASQGFVVTHDLADKLANYQHLQKNAATREAYYKPDGSPYKAGERLRQKDLAWSLKQIGKHGAKAFYQGAIAEKIVKEMAANDGLISAQDLANYRVLERQPVMGDYRGYQIASMPPPSSGGVHLVQILNTLEPFPMGDFGFGTAQSLHLMTEAMKHAYADRSKFLGDPDFVDVPVAALTSKAYGKELAGRIEVEKATPSSQIGPALKLADESRDTTHYSIMDKWGNAVANTYTLNFSYGSGITVPGTGILLNNEMDDFSSKPGVPNAYGLIGAEANAIEGGKRPLSSMTPTFVFKDGKPLMVIGSPGGSRIITTVLQVVINVLDHRMNIADAVHAPRMHHQWLPDRVFMEPGFSRDSQALLQQRGHSTQQVRTMGSVQAIMWQDGYFLGASDPRRPDAAAARPQVKGKR